MHKNRTCYRQRHELESQNPVETPVGVVPQGGNQQAKGQGVHDGAGKIEALLRFVLIGGQKTNGQHQRDQTERNID